MANSYIIKISNSALDKNAGWNMVTEEGFYAGRYGRSRKQYL